MATSGLEYLGSRFTIILERNRQLTPYLRLEYPKLKQPELESHPKMQSHHDMEKPISTLLLKIALLIRSKNHCVLTLEHDRPKRRRVLVALVECGGKDGGEAVVGVEGVGLDLVVVDADFTVRVAHGEVDGEVEGQLVGGGGGEVEGAHGGVGGVEFGLVGADQEPEEEDDYSDDDEDGEDDLEDATKKAAAAVAEAVQEAAAAPATATPPWPVVRLRRRNGWPVVGSV